MERFKGILRGFFPIFNYEIAKCDCGTELTNDNKFLKCQQCNNYYISRTDNYGRIIRGIRFSRLEEKSLTFTEWYKKYDGTEWIYDSTISHRFAIETSNRYENWCRENKVKPIWDA